MTKEAIYSAAGVALGELVGMVRDSKVEPASRIRAAELIFERVDAVEARLVRQKRTP